ncbi:hypothetical protein BJ875DRAFT_83241 [Amylocarpus encephaloides]|uniref:Secreted protein n=1 Tax=Amylocarpus encephaloides TaxID=45428 RepID=A0A9P8CA56_9HELO|nr:hypothetical protein BJ875DRAFT_83241 [Amylocarpus encephaloides]
MVAIVWTSIGGILWGATGHTGYCSLCLQPFHMLSNFANMWQLQFQYFVRASGIPYDIQIASGTFSTCGSTLLCVRCCCPPLSRSLLQWLSIILQGARQNDCPYLCNNSHLVSAFTVDGQHCLCSCR